MMDIPIVLVVMTNLVPCYQFVMKMAGNGCDMNVGDRYSDLDAVDRMMIDLMSMMKWVYISSHTRMAETSTFRSQIKPIR